MSHFCNCTLCSLFYDVINIFKHDYTKDDCFAFSELESFSVYFTAR